jgi:glycosyltransferase involved in cell wall biosynthesis
VEVVTTAARAPAQAPYPVRWISRRLPRGVRHVVGAGLVARRARHAEVVYATSMLTRATIGAAASRRPLVFKLTSDPAFDRARRWRLTRRDLDGFQQRERSAFVSTLERARSLALRRAAHVICPSEYIRELALAWGVGADRITVLPNPMPLVPELPARAELRRRLGLQGATLAFAGRLTAAKSLGVALEAVARTGGVSLLVAGEGDEQAQLEARARELRLDGRVRFLGAQPRERVLELFRAADASILSSSWENFPHTVVEALAVGTPVIATRVGGIEEVVRDGQNGLLVDPGDTGALAAAIERFFAEPALQEALRDAAAPSVADYAPDRIYGRLAEILQAAR